MNYRQLMTVEKWGIALPETNPKLFMQYKVITPEITHTYTQATLSEFKCVCARACKTRQAINFRKNKENYIGGVRMDEHERS